MPAIWSLTCQRPGCDRTHYVYVSKIPDLGECRFSKAELVLHAQQPDGGRIRDAAIDLAEAAGTPLLGFPVGEINVRDSACSGVPRVEDSSQATSCETIDLTADSSGSEEGDSDSGSRLLQETRVTLRRAVRVWPNQQEQPRQAQRACPSQTGDHRRAKRPRSMVSALQRDDEVLESYAAVQVRHAGSENGKVKDNRSVRDTRDW